MPVLPVFTPIKEEGKPVAAEPKLILVDVPVFNSIKSAK